MLLPILTAVLAVLVLIAVMVLAGTSLVVVGSQLCSRTLDAFLTGDWH